MVSKGAGGVAQGSSSVSGVINVMLLEGLARDRVFFNAFGMSHLEHQYNAYATTNVDEWNTIVALHATKGGMRLDRNSDGFMDSPVVDRVSVLNKWSYTDEVSFTTSTGIRFAWEDRFGGQTNFDERLHRGGIDVYGQRHTHSRGELYNRSDIRLGDKNTLRTHAIASWHELEAFYGTTNYDAMQYAGFADAWLVHEMTDYHTVTFGASWAWSELREELGLASNPLGKSYAGAYTLLESVPGAFVESKLALLDEAVSLVTGLRADHYNTHGLALAPRMFIRYNYDHMTTIRLSAGTAFRTATVFSEYAPLLASWRDILVPAALQPEKAVSYGFNIVRHYSTTDIAGTFTLDAFRTEFSNQIVADFDQRHDAVIIGNLSERTATNHVMLEGTAEFLFGTTVRGSYIFTDAVEYHAGVAKSPNFISRHRALGVVSFGLYGDNLTTTLTAEWRSGQNLPATAGAPDEFRLPAVSPAFTLLHIHFNARLGRLDLYVGAENLLDFRQMNPIINARKPFERHFEPTFAWGPVKGREVYIGTRLRIGDF
jgi:outer membrane receptor for ferrienterochelin and colicins